MAAPKQITVTVAREAFRTEIEHRPDGTLVIRQHSYDVVRDDQGVEVGRTNGFTTVIIENVEIASPTRTQIDVITAQAAVKVDALKAAAAVIETP